MLPSSPTSTRQNHPGGRDAQTGRRLPGQPGGPGPGDGLRRPGQGAWHHHPGQNTAISMADVKSTSWTPPATPTSAGGWAHPENGQRRHHSQLDAAAMPQTRFVLSRAWFGPPGHRGHQQDRPARPAHPRGSWTRSWTPPGPGRHRRAAGLPMLFCFRPAEVCSDDPDVLGTDLKPLFETILSYIPAQRPTRPAFQMLVSSIDTTSSWAASPSAASRAGAPSSRTRDHRLQLPRPGAKPQGQGGEPLPVRGAWPRSPRHRASAGNIIAMSASGHHHRGTPSAPPATPSPCPS